MVMTLTGVANSVMSQKKTKDDVSLGGLAGLRERRHGVLTS